ncbi:ribonuclease M5 [Salibacterium salarium]|uniref:Ribonuclease M5 n=1 Tax=Salibacterium salarium TaxID=284579 RepID=A0A3R9P4A3_9BACI|nr:ribonuclease M5 [Salibacterium salarium]RSL30027.1 ribonuclease M5 [Salibacterium salarium]
MNIQECIVVEGKDDTMAVKRAVEADTIETNGSAIGEAVLKRIALAQERRGVIIFTDPDVPGERIRRIVSREVPGCKHAFLTKEDALSDARDNIGIENASPEVIQRAIRRVREEVPVDVIKTERVTRQDLVDAGMMAGSQSRRRREKMGERLNIGYANAKQFLKRLDMFNIQRAEFARAAAEVLEEEATRAQRNSNAEPDEGNS